MSSRVSAFLFLNLTFLSLSLDISSTLASEPEHGIDEGENGYDKEHQVGPQEYAYHPEYDHYNYEVDQTSNGTEFDTNYYDPNEMDYRSQPYAQHDVVGTAYYNAAPVFLRQPVRLFPACIATIT
jgi:PAB-dependent poly(A)-specific ribonuclease subunit 3